MLSKTEKALFGITYRPLVLEMIYKYYLKWNLLTQNLKLSQELYYIRTKSLSKKYLHS